MISDFKAWKKILKKFAVSQNIHKRRASLVMLVSPLRNDVNDDLVNLGLANIDLLKHEKEVLITKAISWLLRSMAKHHKDAVTTYLKNNSTTLPAIAVRETKIMLRTGKKTK